MSEVYRFRGALEQQYAAIEPLPPTQITPDASERLQSWGIPKAYIRRLQEVSSSFRYDLGPEKAHRITERGGYIYESPDGTEEVILPDFLNYEERLDGQCIDLSVQFINLLYSSSFMSDLDQELAKKGKPSIRPCFVKGLSRTHFNRESMGRPWAHVWCGFVQDGRAVEEIVTVDTSLQEISNIGKNGFTIVDCMTNPKVVADRPTAAKFTITDSIVNEDAASLLDGSPLSPFLYESSIPRWAVLASSADRELVYSLSFIRDNSREIIPFLFALTSDSAIDGPYCVRVPNGQLYLSKSNHLTEAQRLEMRDIYTNLGKISLERDQAKAEAAKREITVFIGSFKPGKPGGKN
jgi:hypothetical protein